MKNYKRVTSTTA